MNDSIYFQLYYDKNLKSKWFNRDGDAQKFAKWLRNRYPNYIIRVCFYDGGAPNYCVEWKKVK